MKTESISTPTENDLRWVGGVCDVWGGLKIADRNTTSPHLVLTFSSPSLDALLEIRKATGGLGHLPEAPKRPSKNQVQPQYRLTFRGSDLLRFENMVIPSMRIERRKQYFAKGREDLRNLRQQLGLTSPFALPKRSGDEPSQKREAAS